MLAPAIKLSLCDPILFRNSLAACSRRKGFREDTDLFLIAPATATNDAATDFNFLARISHVRTGHMTVITTSHMTINNTCPS